MNYIDFHCHIGPLWYGREPFTPSQMLGWMDAHDVERSVVLPLESPEATSYYITTETTLAICAKHPDRLLPFCVMDARMSVPSPDSGFRAMLEDYLERGAMGFGEVKLGLPMDHELNQRLWSLCDEFELPVLFHSDGLRLTDDPQLSGLEAMLKAYPKAKFIGHAPGFWSAISGDCTQAELNGYPTGPVAPGGAVPRLLREYPNLFGDLSAGSGNNALTRDAEFGRQFLTEFQHKLLFATDILFQGQETPQFETMARMALPADVHQRIARENAVAMLGL